ncbi:MAG: hypothetical protein ABIG87_00530 [Patescibacteria group bacterium]
MKSYPNTVITIDREFIEKDLKNTGSPLFDEKTGLNDDVYDAIYEEVYDKIGEFLSNCYSSVKNEKQTKKNN